MTGDLSPIDKAKYAAALRAADMVQDGMRVGLGTGSTAAWMVRRLGERVQEEGLRIKAVPTSTRTAQLARELGIEVVSLDQAGWLDLTIDGADEFDGDLNLIKGGGGALTREKIVAQASEKFICIADQSKLVDRLGTFPLPIEVIPMAQSLVSRSIVKMGGQPELRSGFITDNGNTIIDVRNMDIDNPIETEKLINQIPGVVTVGIFAIRPADVLLLSAEQGLQVIK